MRALNVDPSRGSAAGSRRVAATIAGRDAWRYPWRLVLIILLIAVPVAGISAAGTLQVSSDSNRSDFVLQTQYQGFDGVLEPDSGTEFSGRAAWSAAENEDILLPHPVRQHVVVDRWFFEQGDVTDAQRELARSLWRQAADRPTELPDGVTEHPVTTVFAPVATATGPEMMTVVILDTHDDRFFGDGRLLQWRTGGLPVAGDGVLASPEAIEQLERANREATSDGESVLPTDAITFPLGDDESATQPVTGTVASRLDTHVDVARYLGLEWLNPASFASSSVGVVVVDSNSPTAEAILAAGGADMATQRIYLSGPVPSEYVDMVAFSRAGQSAVFRPVAENLDPEVEELFTSASFMYADGQLETILRLIPVMVLGGLAMLEVGLLAGAAFAVGARRSRRLSGLLSVVGAESRTLSGMMLWQGWVCGVLGALLGAGVGVWAGVLIHLRAVQRGLHVPALAIPWLAVAMAVLLGIVCSVVAAWIPARAIARQNAWTALRSASAPHRAPRRATALVGASVLVLTVVVLAVLAVLLRTRPTVNEVAVWMSVYGMVLVLATMTTVIATLMLVPMIIHLTARAARRLPLSLRLAARDADRNRGRTVPVTVAMVAATSIGVLMLTFTALTMQTFAAPSSGDENRVYTVYVPSPETRNETLAQERVYDDEATMEDLAQFTGTKREAEELVRRAIATVPGVQLEALSEVITLHPSCDTTTEAGAAECVSYALTYPQSSQCHLPLPADQHVQQRQRTLGLAMGEASVHQSQACAWGMDPFNFFAAANYQWSQPLTLVDPDRPETWPEAFTASPVALEAARNGRAVVSDPELVDAEGMVTLSGLSHDLTTVAGLEDTTAAEAAAFDVSTGTYDEYYMAMFESEDYGVPTVEPFAGTTRNVPMWEASEVARVPAVVVAEEDLAGTTALLPVSVLEQVSADARPDTLALRFADTLTEQQRRAVNDALDGTFLYLYNDGMGDVAPVGDRTLWLVAAGLVLMLVTVSGITTGLALTDARRDAQILDAVGAAPQTRRTQAAVQAAFAAGIGAVIGLVVGIIPPLSMAAVITAPWAWVPWPQLLTILLLPSLLAAALAWLLVRGRIPARSRGD